MGKKVIQEKGFADRESNSLFFQRMEKKNPHELSFGEKLGDLLSAHKMDQKSLANHLGVSQPTVSNWTQDKGDPNLKNLRQLAELFDVSIDQLVGMPPKGRDKRAASRVTRLSMEAVEILSEQSGGLQEDIRNRFITSRTFDQVTLYIAKIKALSGRLEFAAKFFNDEESSGDRQADTFTLKLFLLEIKEARAKLSSRLDAFLDEYTDYSNTEGAVENIIDKWESLIEQQKGPF